MVRDSFDKTFEKVKNLAESFHSNKGFYLSARYQEPEVRKDFIDKFFIALGWDVNHEKQKNPFKQEVKVEQTVPTGTTQRRADYAFFITPNFRDPCFFTEAKKPCRNIDNSDDCFQTIRYGWNANTLIAILTDFEQFLILDTRYKPDINTARAQIIKQYHYSQYQKSEKFAEIFYLFSRDAVANKSLEEFAETLPKRRAKAKQRGLFKGGWQPVDESFLEELDSFRDALARNFKNHNPKLDSEALTEVTHRTIDRLVFLRFLEDKLIETKTHVAEFGDKGNPWIEFIALCRCLDNVYNGIVFRKHDILDEATFKVDETQFADLCEELAHINSPYDFNSIPIHILGSIYERFLGKVIIATAKRARVEEKPEVRKAGGVYYTPDYIVSYIVDNTVGKLIDGKSPAQIAKMRFADIACGSGSFLISIYDLLLRYHRDWYNEHPKKAENAGCVKRDDGYWHLSLKQKREILLTNIYGVDIDNQAVEVAQLSLYLKLLEEETTASARQYQLELRETILPSLNKNIVCGNSLIGTDILEAKLFPTEEERKINAMNFEDRFTHVMKHGGFDAIVGNPPYGAMLSEAAKNYIKNRYVCQNYQLDSYLLFLERSVKDLLRRGGYFGMIIPNPWLTNLLQRDTRRFITENTRVTEIVHFMFPVFHGVTVDTQIVLLQKENPDGWRAKITIALELDAFQDLNYGLDLYCLEHEQIRWRRLNGDVINIFLTKKDVELADKIKKKGVPIETLFRINVGIKPYQKGKGTPPQTIKEVRERPFDSYSKLNKLYRPYLRGTDINRYQIEPIENRFIKYGPWLAEPRPAANFDSPVKIFMRQTGDSLIATLDKNQYLCLNNMHVLVPKEGTPVCRYVLAILNSKLMNWYYHTLNPEIGEALAEVKRANVAALPIIIPDISNSIVQKMHDRIVRLVDHMLNSKKAFGAARSDKDKDYYESKCAVLDRQLDQLVYELYGLSEDEIKIVEGLEQAGDSR